MICQAAERLSLHGFILADCKLQSFHPVPGVVFLPQMAAQRWSGPGYTRDEHLSQTGGLLLYNESARRHIALPAVAFKMHPFRTATQSYTFPEFLAFVEQLVADGRTTGPDQADFLVRFTKLNLARMKRWIKTTGPSDALVHALEARGRAAWWVITEAWCGDSAQNLPLIAEAADRVGIPLRIILRDDNPEIMDRYLTGTSRSIPKLVALSGGESEYFVWGPRPLPAQTLYDAWRAAPTGRDFEAFEQELHTWYARDKGEALSTELLKLAES